jgi:hypothetical protein
MAWSIRYPVVTTLLVALLVVSGSFPPASATAGEPTTASAHSLSELPCDGTTPHCFPPPPPVACVSADAGNPTHSSDTAARSVEQLYCDILSAV